MFSFHYHHVFKSRFVKKQEGKEFDGDKDHSSRDETRRVSRENNTT
jgi:hypothetical protein